MMEFFAAIGIITSASVGLLIVVSGIIHLVDC